MSNVSNSEKVLQDCYQSYVVKKATQSYVINSIFCCIVNLMFFFFGTFLNALVIYVFWRTPTLRFKISYFMIMVLSCIDILVTLIVHPAYLVLSIAEVIGKARCIYKTFYHIASIVLSGVSLWTFFFMNVERYLSVVHPIFHLRYVTKLRCIMVCVLFWAPMVFGGISAYVANYDGQNLITSLAVIIIIGTCYIYIAIFFVARKKRQRMQQRRTKEEPKTFVVEDSSHSNNVTTDSESLDTRSENNKPDTSSENNKPDTRSENNKTENNKLGDNKPENFNRPNPLTTTKNHNDLQHEKEERSRKTVSFVHDLQLAKMYLLVVFTNFFLNLPNAIGLSLNPDKLTSVDGWVQSKIWTVTLVAMNSTVNSLIFFWANEKLRKEGKKACKRFFRR